MHTSLPGSKKRADYVDGTRNISDQHINPYTQPSNTNSIFDHQSLHLDFFQNKQRCLDRYKYPEQSSFVPFNDIDHPTPPSTLSELFKPYTFDPFNILPIQTSFDPFDPQYQSNNVDIELSSIEPFDDPYQSSTTFTTLSDQSYVVRPFDDPYQSSTTFTTLSDQSYVVRPLSNGIDITCMIHQMYIQVYLINKLLKCHFIQHTR